MNDEPDSSDASSEDRSEPELAAVAVALRRALHDAPADAEPSLATAPLLRAAHRARRRRRAAGTGLGLLLAGGATGGVLVLAPSPGTTAQVTAAAPSSSAPSSSAPASPTGTAGVVGTAPAPLPLPARTSGPDPSLFQCLKEFSVPAASQQRPLLSGWTGSYPVVLAERPGATVLCTPTLGGTALSGSGAKRSAAETAFWHPTTTRGDGTLFLTAFRVPDGVARVVTQLGPARQAEALVGAGWAVAGMPVVGTGLQTLSIQAYDTSGALVHTDTLTVPSTGTD
ncbi:MAG TPA: hypothetical protein VFS29_05915 [Motilibacteraceae bacterium]|nr:hypothetical protein [Motilibacteraceae bacterium]